MKRKTNHTVSDLREIIKERRQYKNTAAQKRRQLDLQRIKDMKSTKGVNPLQLFPKEVWCKIIHELNSEDKYQIWQVHPIFCDLMKTSRIGDILFPLVLTINAFGDCVKKNDDLQLERLRRTSKCMKKSFDIYADRKVISSIDEAETSADFDIAGGLALHVEIGDDRQKLKRLLNNFREDQEIPAKIYCYRTLSIHFGLYLVEDQENLADVVKAFKNDLISLLKLIGHQIWKLRFMLFGVELVLPSTVYILLHRLVSLTKNLKWLEIDIDRVRFDVNLEENGVDACSVFQQYPFPTLNALKRLSFDFLFKSELNNTTTHIHKFVIAANKHVQILDFYEFGKYQDYQLHKDLIKLIKSLPLVTFRPCAEVIEKCVDMQLDNIQHIVSFAWPLTNIYMTLDHTTSEKSSSMTALLKFLERYPNLKTIKLRELKGFKFHATDSFKLIELPNLSHLEVVLTNPEIQLEGNIHVFFSLQVLLRCKKLKTLDWKITYVNQDSLQKHLKTHETTDVLDFRGGLRNIFESNVWRVFPSLDKISVSVTKPIGNVASSSCQHVYFRSDKNISFDMFMKSHVCRIRYSLRYCVHHNHICPKCPSPCLPCFILRKYKKNTLH